MSSVIVGDWKRLYVAGAPRFKHKGKVILFELSDDGDVSIAQALNGEQVMFLFLSLFLFFFFRNFLSVFMKDGNGSERGLHLLADHRNSILCYQLQIGSYYGSEVCGLDVDQDGITDLLLVAAPMYLGSGNKEAGRVYIYSFTGVRQLWHLVFSIGNKSMHFLLVVAHFLL